MQNVYPLLRPYELKEIDFVVPENVCIVIMNYGAEDFYINFPNTCILQYIDFVPHCKPPPPLGAIITTYFNLHYLRMNVC